MNEFITEFLTSRHVGDIGFSSFEKETPFEGLSNAVSLVFHLSEAVVNQIDSAPTHTYFQHYRTMNAYIDSTTLQLVMALQEKGFNAAAVPASQSVDGLQGIFSHKYAAVRAGLGYIGKSALFISNKFGPRVRLGTVFTDAPLETKSFVQKSRCGDCSICAKECGAMAIKNVNFESGMTRDEIFDAKACSDYMKSKFKHIGRGAVCGVCMRVCPKNIDNQGNLQYNIHNKNEAGE
ncbi:MAG: epoxyqueuosine reductase [Clostridia bacterium]|nr:epoxyqueuosine reductase [Clostridia bacterium]